MSELKQYLYRLVPTRLAMVTEGPTEAETESLGRHVSYLEGLAGRGVVLLAGRTQNADASTFGIVILRADGDQRAREIMEADPAVRDRVMTATLFPFRIAFWHSPDEERTEGR